MYSNREQAMGPVKTPEDGAQVMPTTDRATLRTVLAGREVLTIDQIHTQLETLETQFQAEIDNAQRRFLADQAEEFGVQQMINYFGLQRVVQAISRMTNNGDDQWMALMDNIEPDPKLRHAFYDRLPALAREYYAHINDGNNGRLGTIDENDTGTMYMVERAAGIYKTYDTPAWRWAEKHLPVRKFREDLGPVLVESVVRRFHMVAQRESHRAGITEGFQKVLTDHQGNLFKTKQTFRSRSIDLEIARHQNAQALAEQIARQIDMIRMDNQSALGEKVNPLLQRLQESFVGHEDSPMLSEVAEATQKSIAAMSHDAYAQIEPQIAVLQNALRKAAALGRAQATNHT